MERVELVRSLSVPSNLFRHGDVVMLKLELLMDGMGTVFAVFMDGGWNWIAGAAMTCPRQERNGSNVVVFMIMCEQKRAQDLSYRHDR
jgi:hypothetical protein